MKKLKILLIFGVLMLLIALISLYIIRTPSYTIKTSGKLYIVNKISSNITVFDLENGEELVELPIEIEPHEVTTLQNQSKVVVTNYGAPDVEGQSISVINTKTNTVERTIELDGSLRPHGIITFPKANTIGAVTDKGNHLLVVNTKTGVIEKKIATNEKMSHLLVHHPFKPLVFVSNVKSNAVVVIDLVTNQVIKRISCGIGTEGIDISPDGQELWVSNNKDNTINVIDTETFQITHTLNTGIEPLRLKISVDGKYCLVTNATGGTISVYNRITKMTIKTIVIPGKKNIIDKILYHTPRPVGLLMHPNGEYAFVANSNANKVEVIDMNTFSLVSTIGTGDAPDGLAIIN